MNEREAAMGTKADRAVAIVERAGIARISVEASE